MQYMILMGYKVEGVPPITNWNPEDIKRHIEFQQALGRDDDRRSGSGRRDGARAPCRARTAGRARVRPRVAGSDRLAAVRAHLLELAGDTAGAIAAYETAANCTASAPEKHYLVTRAARLGSRVAAND